jgi:uncharacterized glyoxalase superfamily protein PhnB
MSKAKSKSKAKPKAKAKTKPKAKATNRAKAAPSKIANRQTPETLRVRSVSAGLTVSDVNASIKWYRDVLGFVVEEEWKHEGKLMGASMLAGAARFFIGQDDWAKGRDRKKGEGFRLHLATAQSVDAIAARIKATGGKLESEPTDMPWGTRAFALADPDGFKLTISSEA